MENNKSGKIIEFSGSTSIDSDPDKILKQAIGKVESAIVIGWNNEGDFYFNSSIAGGPECVWLMEIAKKLLIRG